MPYGAYIMNKMYKNWIVSGSSLCVIALGFSSIDAEKMTFHGLADASASVFLDSEHFVVADDESNSLRIYHIDKSPNPLSVLDLSAFLGVRKESPESDIEAAAKTGDRIYWITSHGRNRNGKIRTSRCRFFSTHIHIKKTDDASTPPELTPIGTPCTTLLQQLLTHTSTAQPILSRATRIDDVLSKKEQKKLAPKRDGLNIEGLAWHLGHKSLLIGLRNPLYTSPDGTHQNYAIVIELKNPARVIENQQAAKFGQVLYWDLDGRGIRGMEYCSFSKTFFILAGPVDAELNFALYAWDGLFGAPPKVVYQWPKQNADLKPEGIAVNPLRRGLWVFSDDGSVEVAIDSPTQCMEGELLDNGRCLNKHLINDAQKSFRVWKLSLPNTISPTRAVE